MSLTVMLKNSQCRSQGQGLEDYITEEVGLPRAF